MENKEVKFGLAPNLYPPEVIFKAAEICENYNLDGIWLADHVVAIGIKRFHAVDAWSMLAALAVKTKRIRLGTAVSDTHRRHPETFAQIVATVDILSGGRTILGVGAGESMNLDPFGINWDKPVARMKEAIILIKKLWVEESVSYEGKFFRFNNAILDLKPVQKPHPPIWIGANSIKSLKVTAELGDGWIPIPTGPENYSKNLSLLKEYARNLGRNPDQIVPGILMYICVAEKDEDVKKMYELPAKFYSIISSRPEFHFTKMPFTRETAMKAFQEVLKLEVPFEKLKEELPFPIGTPEECAEKLREYIRAGVKYFVLVPMTRPEDCVYASELCVKKVIPNL
ncbi:MAG: LLM class flavin-dependent oxidoreductase [Thermoproteota archaeon]|jgi:alkanesulfonate monooxygenase SsuD/methylene tetrahydromethanopterin reductase-like flavin-dependent oxidoreductase (luciferase family)|nr:LLM class flavin-dependent oxidoreductase [Thermoproteota archaeon]